MKTNKIFSFLLLMFLLLAMPSCGRGGDSDDDDNAPCKIFSSCEEAIDQGAKACDPVKDEAGNITGYYGYRDNNPEAECIK